MQRKRDCRGFEADLTAYLHGELNARRSRAVRAHLDRCPGCAEAYRELRSVRALAAAVEDIEPSLRFRRRIETLLQDSPAIRSAETGALLPPGALVVSVDEEWTRSVLALELPDPRRCADVRELVAIDERRLPLHDRALSLLSAYLESHRLDADQPLFINYQGDRLTRQSLWKITKERGERHGIGNHLTPNTIRNSLRQHLEDGGAPKPLVDYLMGFDTEALDKTPAIVALKKRFGLGEELIETYSQPYLYLNYDVIRANGLDQAEVEAAVAEELLRFDGVAAAVSSTALRTALDSLLDARGIDTTLLLNMAREAALDAERCEIYSDVDGVYSADPVKDPDARMYTELDYDSVIESKLCVMDANAIVLCRDQQMPIRVFNVFGDGNLARIVRGVAIGTLVS